MYTLSDYQSFNRAFAHFWFDSKIIHFYMSYFSCDGSDGAQLRARGMERNQI